MSVISDIHSFDPFNAKTSKPYPDQRLAKVTYKKTKDCPEPRKSVCVSVPQVDMAAVTDEQLVKLAPHIRRMLETAQDGIIRARYEAGESNVTSEQISVDNCIAWLDAEAAGSRLTGDKVREWLTDSGIAAALRARFAEILGVSGTPTAEQEKRIEQQYKGYADMFAGLAGAKTYYLPEQAKKLQKALTFAETEDAISERFAVRLQQMIDEPKDMEDLLAL